MAIIDELGRGTSTRDGLAIALAIAEALVESRALIWFATHFRDLSQIMAERNGVVNLHLAVDMSGHDRMEMLYQIANGTVQEKRYGLKLARVVPLPPDVIPHAETVALALERQVERKHKRSAGVVLARRRKLLLNLKEHLLQARDGVMNDETMKGWLKDLQREFVVRMTALDEESRAIQAGESDGEDEEMEQEAPTEGSVQDTTETAPSTWSGHHSEQTQTVESQRQPTPAVWRDANGVEIVDATEMDDSFSVHTTAGSTSRIITTATTDITVVL
jgi:DNA mismatch repair protein MSH4